MRRFFHGFLGVSEASSPRKRPKTGNGAMERTLITPEFEARKGGFQD